MTSALGFNIHLRYLKQSAKLLTRIAQFKPAVVLAMIDKDEHIPYIFQLQQEVRAVSPETRIVARVHHDLDGAFHTKPEPPDERFWIASPQDYLNKYGGLGKNGLILNVLNEPGTDNEWVDRLLDWSKQVVEKAVRDGVSICIENLSTGHPPLMNNESEWDKRFDPLLELLSQHRDRGIYLGLHEYLPGIPSRVGRINAMIARCKTRGISPPRTIMTEFGVDENGSKTNGYKSRGWSGAYYVGAMTQPITNIYMPLMNEGILMGACLFSYGDSSLGTKWPSFDVEEDQSFWDALEKAAPNLEIPPRKPNTKPLPPPPEPKPGNAKYPHRVIVRFAGAHRNLRSGPSEAHRDIGDVKPGTAITLYEEPTRTDTKGQHWRYVETPVGDGWLYIDHANFDNIKEEKPTFDYDAVFRIKAENREAAEVMAQFMAFVINHHFGLLKQHPLMLQNAPQVSDFQVSIQERVS